METPTTNSPSTPPPAALDVISNPKPQISVTPKAIAKIRAAFAKQGVVEGEGGLRLGVLGGGCSGLSYQFKFDGKPRERDHVMEFDGVRIFVDPKSMLFLNGMTLDYKESLMQSGFAFKNPHAKKACGCGTSFSA
ncbi:MAG: iron-sulfur cluster assembly accessory protein [Acidobacteria bacterium]|nr:iron-sulfur cluster assembly accessory protein [Acidobacteriota bacterium]